MVIRSCPTLAVFIFACLWLMGGSFSRGYEPILRLPAIDATQPRLVASQLSTSQAAFRIDPWPATGPDWNLFTPRLPQQFPGSQVFDPNGSFELNSPDPAHTIVPLATISPHKNGFFQKLEYSGTWLNGDAANSIGITELITGLTVAVPLPTVDYPMLITTGFETRFFNGPRMPDLPGQVYSAYVKFIWVPKMGDRWRGMFGIEPGFYGDFENSNERIVRWLGRALVRYEWIPGKLQLVGGIVYLDREDYKLLPGGGVIWIPNEEWLFQLIAPIPKIARRVSWDGEAEHWIYIAGEVGGDTWGVERASGAVDRLTMIDFRALAGIERKLDGGAGARLEFGYVFGRNLQFASSTADFELDDTFLIRGVFAF